MRKATLVAVVAVLLGTTACEKTGEGEYKAVTPDVDVNVSTDTNTIRTPSIETGTRQDTVIVNRPTVDVKTPAEQDAARRKP